MPLSRIIKEYRLGSASVLVRTKDPELAPAAQAVQDRADEVQRAADLRQAELVQQEAERRQLLQDAAMERDQALKLRQEAETERAQLDRERQSLTAAARAEAAALVQRAGEEKEQVLATARQEAERIITDAESRRFEIKQAAHQEGHAAGLAEGRAKGYDEGKAELAQLGKTLQDIIIEINNQRADLVHRAEPKVVDLALAVARKVINVELEHNREIIRDLVREAIGRLKTRERVVVRVHPDDLDNLREYKNDLLLVFSEVQDLSLREDRNMARGGVVVETESSVVDSRLETRLGKVEKEIERLK